MWRTSSRPSPSGRRMSVRHRSKRSLASAAPSPRRSSRRSHAEAHLEQRELEQLADVGLVVDDQHLGASRWRRAALGALHAGRASRHRILKCAPGHVVDVLEDRAVGAAQLAREVQAEAGALAVGGEEGLEELPLVVRPARPARRRSRQFYAVGGAADGAGALRAARRARGAPRSAAGSTAPGAGARGRTRSTPRARRLEREALGAARDSLAANSATKPASQRRQADALARRRGRGG